MADIPGTAARRGGSYAWPVSTMPDGGRTRQPLTGAARTALVSVGAAVVLIAIKLIAGISANSLALISEAVHSCADLVAALLAFLALRVAGRPPDADHPYGHGKAEHLSALIEGMMLVAASAVIIYEAVTRLVVGGTAVTPSPWVFAVVIVIIGIDAARAITSWRASRRHHSAALAAGAVHFVSDMAGSLAVLIGLIAVEAGYPGADAVAALVVAALVLIASGALLRQNADILLDRAAADDVTAARAAIADLGDVETRRLRLRSAGGHHWADVVVAVPPGAALAQAHATADLVEDALERALPGIDAVVHVEPGTGPVTERVRAAAQGVSGVREVHNVQLLDVDGHTEVSLHLKLPAETRLADADAAAHQVQAAVRTEVPEVVSVRTHVEPLTTEGAGHQADGAGAARTATSIRGGIADDTGYPPAEVRLVDVAEGQVAFVVIELPASLSLAEAHAIAGRARRAGQRADPGLVDVFVQTTAVIG
jgi:cation diffusion facilitator family transporter